MMDVRYLDYCFKSIYVSKLYTFKYTQLTVYQLYLTKAIKKNNVNVLHIEKLKSLK